MPVLLMLGVMYYFSTDLFSGENTRGAIGRILTWLWPNGTSYTGRINFVVRKTMHFVEYAVLAALLFRAFRAESPIRWKLSWALYTLAIVAVWAFLDELHQGRTTRRGASIYDSLLDLSGGACMLVVIGLVNRRKRSRN
jgi:VanZ family protein